MYVLFDSVFIVCLFYTVFMYAPSRQIPSNNVKWLSLTFNSLTFGLYAQ